MNLLVVKETQFEGRADVWGREMKEGREKIKIKYIT